MAAKSPSAFGTVTQKYGITVSSFGTTLGRAEAVACEPRTELMGHAESEVLDVERLARTSPSSSASSAASQWCISTTRPPRRRPNRSSRPSPTTTGRQRQRPPRSPPAQSGGRVAYEDAHDRVAEFIGASGVREEIVFTKNTTESENLVAYAWGLKNSDPATKSFSRRWNTTPRLVTWQQIAKKTGATCRYIRVDEDGTLDMDHAREIITDDTAMVSVVHVSNTLGTVNPVSELADIAHDHDSYIFVDGAQSVPNRPSTWKPSMPTSSLFRATRCSARPVSASSTARGRFSKR